MPGTRVATALFQATKIVSLPVYIGAGHLVGLLFPSSFGTAVKFDGSADGVTYGAVYESSGGVEVSLVVAPGQFVTLAERIFGVRWIQLKTGTDFSNTPREVKLVIEVLPT